MGANHAVSQPTNHLGRQRGPQIDIVYLWVDGSDPEWQARRQQAFSEWTACQAGELAAYGNVSGRYRDNGELRFNLRALERFFPDHGHIYIVTDRQIPRWLRSHGGVTVVDHRELMPKDSLPVFDSGHIESYVHQIPGLSEQFFYLNDDTFFGAPVNPDDWFGPRLTLAMEALPTAASDQLCPDATALVNAAALSARWLRSQYPAYRHDYRLFAHAPRPMLKSAMFELERLAPQLFRQVRSTVFRSWRVPPLVSDLVLRWMVHAGFARQICVEPVYICTGEHDAERLFSQLEDSFGRLPFFCVNDTCDEALPDDPRLRRISTKLTMLLPLPSAFERDSHAAVS